LQYGRVNRIIGHDELQPLRGQELFLFHVYKLQAFRAVVFVFFLCIH
jgi:hypothetical protein